MNKSGGANTNKNGLSFENFTSLKNELELIEKKDNYQKIKFKNNNKELILVNKSKLFKYMEKNNKLNKNIDKAHGCKEPDECYIDEAKKIIYIIEKKFQKVNGSVCEKIQTPDFKIWQYSRTFPDFKINYIYCLSIWFKENCKAELQYLDYKNIKYFFGNGKNYKKEIIDLMINYKE